MGVNLIQTNVATAFRINDLVRFIGTDTVLTVTEHNEGTRLYRVQRGNDGLSSNGY